ncbi:MAG: hypothetical protein GX446_08265 [Chthonomonadales bacterium]|nr:hypothetical protein [Chthonomonadales bacterium]
MSVSSPDSQTTVLYGIGEWFGRLFDSLTPDDRRDLLDAATTPTRATLARCPFRPDNRCNKRGGVCSLTRYEITRASAGAETGVRPIGELVTLCPERFLENHLVYRWVAETLLDCAEPQIATEVDFLRRPVEYQGADVSGMLSERPEAGVDRSVGRIDCVLVAPPSDEPMRWCALEAQAVYFSGASMSEDFRLMRGWAGPGIPPPSGRRRPDWRSSGPKRLMPQLQIKVPALRRWGKKMAVVVDRSFFGSLSHMDPAHDVSNCDIAWFVVRYVKADGRARLQPDRIHLTTLERAVEGLTAGIPLSQSEFEERIRAKLATSG